MMRPPYYVYFQFAAVTQVVQDMTLMVALVWYILRVTSMSTFEHPLSSPTFGLIFVFDLDSGFKANIYASLCIYIWSHSIIEYVPNIVKVSLVSCNTITPAFFSFVYLRTKSPIRSWEFYIFSHCAWLTVWKYYMTKLIYIGDCFKVGFHGQYWDLSIKYDRPPELNAPYPSFGAWEMAH